MLLLDAFFRFSGIALLITIVSLTVRDNQKWPSSIYLILSSLSVCALFLGYTLDEFQLPGGWHHAMRILDVPHLVMVWLFALSLYRKDFELTLIHVGAGLFYCMPILWIRLSGFGIAPAPPESLIPLISVASLILVGHLIYAILSERPDDLLAARRASRLYFVLMIVFVAVIAAISEPILISTEWIKNQTFKILTIWPAITMAALWLLQARNREVNPHNLALLPNDISGRDRELKRKLDQAMEQEEIFRTADLTILELAKHLGVTQHRLRALINDTLGYQNFSSYVNRYRISAIKALLADENLRHVPIQTIAMDCGFKSMSPFNRAFRLSEGVTPSDYRITQMEYSGS